MKIRVLLLALVVLLVGCNPFGSDDSSDLRERQRRWDRLGMTDYTYDFQRICFCGGPVRPLRVVVRDNKVFSVTDLETNVAPQDMPQDWVGTIDDIFSEVQRAYDNEAAEIDLAFNRVYHFPVWARIDRIKGALDDELSLELSNFVPLR